MTVLPLRWLLRVPGNLRARLGALLKIEAPDLSTPSKPTTKELTSAKNWKDSDARNSDRPACVAARQKVSRPRSAIQLREEQPDAQLQVRPSARISAFMRAQLISCRLPRADSALLRSSLLHHLCRSSRLRQVSVGEGVPWPRPRTRMVHGTVPHQCARNEHPIR